jgi:response regulator RpfG family c-di-GMP phosphodiesterase
MNIGSKPNLQMHPALALNCDATAQLLAGEGVPVTRATSVLEADRLLDAHTFGLALVHWQEPNRHALLSRLATTNPDTRRILVLDHPEDEALETKEPPLLQPHFFLCASTPGWLQKTILTAALREYDLLCRNAVLNTVVLNSNARVSKLTHTIEHLEQIIEEHASHASELSDALEQHVVHTASVCLDLLRLEHPQIAHHNLKAVEICRILGESTHLSAEDQRLLQAAAALQDVGCIGLQPFSTSNPAALPSLTLSLAEGFHEHPARGALIADSITGNPLLASIVRAHHEHFDGSGFPDRLAERDIPWLARLLAVANAWCQAPDPQAGLAVLQAETGKKLDPEAVRFFSAILPAKLSQSSTFMHISPSADPLESPVPLHKRYLGHC